MSHSMQSALPSATTGPQSPERGATGRVRPAAARAGGRAAPGADRWVLTAALAIPAAVTLLHLPYYLVSRAERLRHPDHALLKPSGPLGLAFGIAGLALFLFMWLYPLRKKWRWLAFTGAVGQWLRIHVLAGLALPLLVAVHAGWRFEGLIGLGYGAMFLVSLSGIVGRYLYTRIPRSVSGLELTIDEAANERRALITRIAATTGLDPAVVERSLIGDTRSYAGLDPFRTIGRMLGDDWRRWRTTRLLARHWSRPRADGRTLDRRALAEALRLARREMALSQQARMLDTTRRLFGYWHVAHRPIAVTALLAVLVHVAVAILVGAVAIG